MAIVGGSTIENCIQNSLPEISFTLAGGIDVQIAVSASPPSADNKCLTRLIRGLEPTTVHLGEQFLQAVRTRNGRFGE
jgi:hypothetical protein